MSTKSEQLKSRVVKRYNENALKLKIQKLDNRINYRDRMIKFYEKIELYEKCHELLIQKKKLLIELQIIKGRIETI